MTAIRRALVWTATEKYLGIVIQFAYIAAISRLLTPHEFGISALGAAVFTIAESLRDFGATTYIIQRREVTLEALRASFTVLLATSLIMAGALVSSAAFLADYYQEPRLVSYLYVLAAGFLMGPFAGPVMALMRREMDFGRIAVVNLAVSIATALVTVVLALLDFSYMSLAWGALAGAATAPVVANALRPEFRIFRLNLHSGSEVITFGGVASITAVLNRAYEALPLLILGRILPFEAVGLFQRATSVCQLPDRFIMAAISPIALPAFAATAREGGELKKAYLQAIRYVTAVHFPALVMLAVLAHPVVRVLLGAQWIDVAPLVQIMALAMLVMFPAMLTYPVLVATGRVQDTLWASLISLPLSAVAIAPAAYFGLKAIALSMFLTLPLQVFVALWFIRRQVPFTWSEFASSIAPSFVATFVMLTGPALIVTLNGYSFDLPIASAALAGLLAAAGWLAGLRLAGHPLYGALHELWTRSFSRFGRSSEKEPLSDVSPSASRGSPTGLH